MELAGYLDALDYAIRQHDGVMRKNGRRLFVTHPVAAAEELRAAGIDDTPTLQAALLHDVIEDTTAKYEDLLKRFGAEVADLVVEVSDDVRQPRAERRKAQLQEAASLSAAARAIKLADLAANLDDLRHSPPDGWDAARIESYRSHCRCFYEALVAAGGANEALQGRVGALLA